jgi:hypothetical protein
LFGHRRERKDEKKKNYERMDTLNKQGKKKAIVKRDQGNKSTNEWGK